MEPAWGFLARPFVFLLMYFRIGGSEDPGRYLPTSHICRRPVFSTLLLLLSPLLWPNEERRQEK